MAEQGAKVLLLARNESELAKVRDSLPDPSNHRLLVADLAKLPQLLEQVQAALSEVGPIHILVCNSGGPKGGPLLDAKPEEFLQAFQQHVLANHLLVQMLVPGMKDAGYGRIINIISTSVKMPIPNLGVSNTIRGAVASWAKTLANELGPIGITVNNVLPGYTATDRLSTLIEATAGRLNQAKDKVEHDWKMSVPLRRFAKPEETAQAVGYLASPAGAYINGINLPVDGGRLGCL